MTALRFYCQHCDRPLISLQCGKWGRCPRCRAKVRAPLGLPVQYRNAYGYILGEREYTRADDPMRKMIMRLRDPELRKYHLRRLEKRRQARNARCEKALPEPPDSFPQGLQTGMLTVKQAAQRAGVCVGIVYQWVAVKVLPCYRLGRPGTRGKIIIDLVDLEAFLRTLRVEDVGPPPPPPPRRKPAAYKHLRVQ